MRLSQADPCSRQYMYCARTAADAVSLSLSRAIVAGNSREYPVDEPQEEDICRPSFSSAPFASRVCTSGSSIRRAVAHPLRLQLPLHASGKTRLHMFAGQELALCRSSEAREGGRRQAGDVARRRRVFPHSLMERLVCRTDRRPVARKATAALLRETPIAFSK